LAVSQTTPEQEYRLNTAESLEVRKDDLSSTRLSATTQRHLQAGEVLCGVDRFALTANNITYGVVGEKIGYWQFFPAEEGWGVIPVWGFADVIDSHHPDIAEGERLYGYFPMGTQVILQPQSIKPERLIDGSPHRAKLPAVYNNYARTAGEPQFDRAMEDERMLLLPLYATSYCLYDFLQDNNWFGADQLVIISASSKTALGLAIALAMARNEDAAAPPVIALTSQRNRDWVQTLGLYQQVCSYENLKNIDAGKPTVIVDMSGNGQVLSDLHAHLGDNMRYCSNVGITHYADTQMGPGFIRARSAMFFAPTHIQKRAADWGPGVFQQKSFEFWHKAAVQSGDWLKLEYFDGTDGMQSAYQQMLNGHAQPAQGFVVQL
jgi:hypothetical protein